MPANRQTPAMTLLAFLLPLNSALAHDQWTNGTPVAPSVKASCCGPADAKLLDPTDVIDTAEGYRIKNIPGSLIPHGQLLPSPDGRWWVFVKQYGDGTFGPIYCFFGPVTF